MANPDHQHRCGQAFARVDGESGPIFPRRKESVLTAARVATAERKCKSKTAIADRESGPSQPAEQTSRPSMFRKGLMHFTSSHFTHSRSESTVVKQPQVSPAVVNQDVIFEVTAEAKYEARSVILSSLYMLTISG
jgi:hypothetical protein